MDNYCTVWNPSWKFKQMTVIMTFVPAISCKKDYDPGQFHFGAFFYMLHSPLTRQKPSWVHHTERDTVFIRQSRIIEMTTVRAFYPVSSDKSRRGPCIHSSLCKTVEEKKRKKTPLTTAYQNVELRSGHLTQMKNKGKGWGDGAETDVAWRWSRLSGKTRRKRRGSKEVKDLRIAGYSNHRLLC